MNSAVRVALSIALALFLGFGIGFLFVPDPTGMFPVLVGSSLTVVLAPVLYKYLATNS